MRGSWLALRFNSALQHQEACLSEIRPEADLAVCLSAYRQAVGASGWNQFPAHDSWRRRRA